MKKSARSRTVAVLQDDLLAEELEAVHSELGRVDSKASMLLGLAGGGLVFSAAAPAGIGGWVIATGMAFAAVSLIPLLGVVRPRLGTKGFFRHARQTPQEVYENLTKANSNAFRSEQLAALSRIAVHKFRQLRVAVGLQLASLFLVFAGALILMI